MQLLFYFILFYMCGRLKPRLRGLTVTLAVTPTLPTVALNLIYPLLQQYQKSAVIAKPQPEVNIQQMTYKSYITIARTQQTCLAFHRYSACKENNNQEVEFRSHLQLKHIND